MAHIEPYYERGGIRIYVGDNRDVLPLLPAQTSAVVTDPPYGLSFMGKGWDHSVPGIEFWQAIMAAMLPGAHLLAFGGTRTYHRMGVAIEDAGYEIRDTLQWIYATGFPKSHNLKDEWQGWGTALKPAYEPIIMARAPFKGNVAANVLAFGTGAINIDASRIHSDNMPKPTTAPGWDSINAKNAEGGYRPDAYTQGDATYTPNSAGRWPANVLLDEDAAALLDAMSGKLSSHDSKAPKAFFYEHNRKGAIGAFAHGGSKAMPPPGRGDTGGASRFFYVAKASRRERNAGLEGMPEREQPNTWGDLGAVEGNPRKPNTGHVQRVQNHHPTVKPLALMRYLIQMVTPPGGIVLDPFMGSGSTLVAAAMLGFPAIGIELSEEYAEIAARRIDHALNERAGKLPGLEVA